MRWENALLLSYYGGSINACGVDDFILLYGNEF